MIRLEARAMWPCDHVLIVETLARPFVWRCSRCLGTAQNVLGECSWDTGRIVGREVWAGHHVFVATRLACWPARAGSSSRCLGTVQKLPGERRPWGTDCLGAQAAFLHYSDPRDPRK